MYADQPLEPSEYVLWDCLVKISAVYSPFYGTLNLERIENVIFKLYNVCEITQRR